jgi:hypothetical protein
MTAFRPSVTAALCHDNTDMPEAEAKAVGEVDQSTQTAKI